MKENNNLAWEEIKTEHIVQNEWIDFRASTYRFPDGRDIGPFYSYSRRDYVVIVASDEDGNYLCVKQFRQGMKEVTYESDEWQHLLTIPSNATIADNYAYIFKATNCRKSSGQELDDFEFVDVIKHTEEEIEEMISKGEFQQAMHVMAWLLAKDSAAVR